MIITIQLVSIRWTKASRNVADATLRNSLPRVFELPKHGAEILFHHVILREENKFAAEHSIEEKKLESDRLLLHGISIHSREKQLKVDFRWDWTVGAPERKSKTIFELKEGEWGQFSFNGRSSTTVGGSSHEWFYEESIYNIWCGPRSPKMFLETLPNRSKSEKADLR